TGSLPSMTETTELVVPRSIPIIFAMCVTPYSNKMHGVERTNAHHPTLFSIVHACFVHGESYAHISERQTMCRSSAIFSVFHGESSCAERADSDIVELATQIDRCLPPPATLRQFVSRPRTRSALRSSRTHDAHVGPLSRELIARYTRRSG